MLIRSIYVLIFISTLVVLSGFLNTIHPFFDSISHFRVHFLALLIFLLIILFILTRGKKRYAIFFAIIITSLVCLNTFLISVYILRVSTIVFKHNITMMDFNLRFDNKHIDKVQDYMRKNRFDVVTLQEVNDKNRAKFEELKDQYPYQAYCEFTGVGGEMILSKYPFTNQGNCLKGRGLLWREVVVDDTRFSLVALHLHWPYPYGQYEQVTTLSKELEQIKGPIVLAGDFNASPWSYSVERIAKASGSELISGVIWTKKFDTPILPMWLPIDHFLVSGFYVEGIKVGDDLGSDHLPILMHLKFD